jgi:hypothetical protein
MNEIYQSQGGINTGSRNGKGDDFVINTTVMNEFVLFVHNITHV